VEILPAIDLLDGSVVRLERGDYEKVTTYSDDPAAVARRFAEAGARWVHVVDLDAARTGRPTNTGAVADIRRALDTRRAACQGRAVDLRIQLGGGARDSASIDAMLDMRVDRVVVGSAALRDWEWFEGLLARDDLAGRLALGLDARAGRLAVDGWTKELPATAVELSRRVKGAPLGAIVYTDIARDGMLTGVNVEATADVIAATDVAVIASGGVSSVDDVAVCRRIGCAGVIVGKAWYEGRLDLQEALAAAE